MPDRLYNECRELIAQGRVILEDLREWGYDWIPDCAESSPSGDLAPCSAGAAAPVASGELQFATLAELETSLQGCSRCGLCRERNHIVFGGGNPNADLVLVAEAPGREEDLQGGTFVGEAGRLLDRILLAMQLTRDDIYICNVLKCHPPHNRDPEADEIEACEPYLIRQLELIKPRMIVTLGRFAAQALLQTKAPIGRLRGEWHEYQGIPLMPTYHPAYLLRTPSGKKDVWSDMKQVLQRLQS
jgi:DNA polymerase